MLADRDLVEALGRLWDAHHRVGNEAHHEVSPDPGWRGEIEGWRYIVDAEGYTVAKVPAETAETFRELLDAIEACSISTLLHRLAEPEHAEPLCREAARWCWERHEQALTESRGGHKL